MVVRLKMRFDLGGKGLGCLFRAYQIASLRFLWENGPNGSGRVWGHICEDEVTKKSRASVIFFLNDMVDEGILVFDDATGKGGHHRIYRPCPGMEDEASFKVAMADRIKRHLEKEFFG